jgi:hypothetical protein
VKLFGRDVLVQALGTVIGGVVLIFVLKLGGVIEGVDWSSILKAAGTAAGVLAAVAALLASKKLQDAVLGEVTLKAGNYRVRVTGSGQIRLERDEDQDE